MDKLSGNSKARRDKQRRLILPCCRNISLFSRNWAGSKKLSMESPVLPAIIAVAAVVASFLGLRLLRWLRERRRYRYHPLAGTVADQIIHYRRIYDHLTDLSRRYKTFRVLMGLVRYEIYTCDPAVVEHILSSNFRDYGKVSGRRERKRCID